MEKTDNPVTIDFVPSLLEFIPNFNELEPDDLVFNLPAKSIISTVIQGWSTASGINKHITYHTSRHTFITGILTYNHGDIQTAKELAGHSDIKITLQYAHMIDGTRKKAIQNLPILTKNLKKEI